MDTIKLNGILSVFMLNVRGYSDQVPTATSQLP